MNTGMGVVQVPRNRRLPSLEVVQALVDEGLSNREIGERYSVTGEAVRQLLERHGVRRPHERTSHGTYIPWRIRADHGSDVIAKRLRAYSKRQQGVPLTEKDSRLLDGWIEYMNGANPFGVELSVHYDRNDPEGFYLKPRVSGDRDFIHPPQSG
jgi:hypothetical protein